MGTSATTRLSKDKDYIEFFTRWDGIPSLIKEEILAIPEHWLTAIALFKKELSLDEYGTSGLREWLLDLEKVLEHYMQTNDLESAAVLFSNRSFVHHHAFPAKAEGDYLENCGKGHPAIVAKLGNPIIFEFSEHLNDDDILVDSTVSRSRIVARPINEEYKILRIQSLRFENNSKKLVEHVEYIDLKYKGISREEIMREVLLLPLFWRDLYTISKKIEDIIQITKVKKTESAISYLPIMKLARKLKNFYSPTKKYHQRGERSYIEDIPFSLSEKEDYKKEILMEIRSSIPLDMATDSLASQLSFRFPGKVYPLTESENRSNKEVSLTLYMHEKGTTDFYFKPENVTDFTYLFNDVQSKFLERELKFFNYYGLDKQSIKYELSQNNNRSLIGIRYENSIVEVMQSQRDIEFL